MSIASTLLVTMISGVLVGCHSGAEPVGPSELLEDGYIDVLFIGSSLTYWHDMPQAVAALTTQMNETVPMRFADVSYPNFNLEDHWDHGRAPEEMARRGWEYVVLQQGPSSLPENRLQLIFSTKKFAEVIRPTGAVPALFAAWPQENRKMDFLNAAESYRLAAAEVKGELLPVSTAWRLAMEMDPGIRLYEDGLHPSEAGAYLTAIVIYGGLYDRTVRNLPNSISGSGLSVSSAVGTLLRAAADSALTLARQ